MKDRRELLTVLCENVLLDRDTGYVKKSGWVLYSSPTSPAMALAIAENVKRAGKSYRIVTNDNGPGSKIVAQWCRSGFKPDDGVEDCELTVTPLQRKIEISSDVVKELFTDKEIEHFAKQEKEMKEKT